MDKIKYIKIEGDKGRCPKKLIGVSENGTYFLDIGVNSIEANDWHHVQDYPFQGFFYKLADNQQIDLTAITNENTWDKTLYSKDEEGNTKFLDVTPWYNEGKYKCIREYFDRLLNNVPISTKSI
jgi:hypothetical protein|tara:strand:- start:617 stop:988 length:372 start_codon:yes stop_codon:yes gene_type:complete